MLVYQTMGLNPSRQNFNILDVENTHDALLSLPEDAYICVEDPTCIDNDERLICYKRVDGDKNVYEYAGKLKIQFIDATRERIPADQLAIRLVQLLGKRT
jgi:hypothetical protein